jgi:hypothetical protein
MSWIRTFTSGLALLALSGCASVFLVDNQVQSYARWGERSGAPAAAAAVPQAPQVYRFERLPSQRQGASAASQSELENLTAQAMTRLGWTQVTEGTAAPWTVQVNASTLRLPRAPWEDPYDTWRGFGPGYGFPGRDYYVTGTGQVIFAPPMMFMRMETPYYQRQVSVVVRHAATGQVVYETRAAHDGRWHSSNPLWSAMLEAALRGFPTPPEGLRQVDIEVPR